MADTPLKQPELQLPTLQPLPGPNEPAPLTTGQNIARALSIFVTGISRPDLAAALAQQFQQQDEAAKAEAENRFRNDMFTAQAINAQRVQEFKLQQEAAAAPGEAKLQQLQIQQAEQNVAAGKREERKAGVYTPESQGAIAQATDLAQLENLRTEIALHKATLANLQESIKNAQSEDVAQEYARVHDYLNDVYKKKLDMYDSLVATQKAGVQTPESLAMQGYSVEESKKILANQPAPRTPAELFTAATTVEQNEQAAMLADIKAIAPHIPEENLRGLIAQAFNIPRPSNNETVDSWMKAIHELNSLAGPAFIPVAAAQTAKAFIAGGLPEDEANAAAADVLTNEQPPESVLQKLGKAAGQPGAFLGKSVGKAFGLKPRKP